jgi:hypothetical protein
MGACFDGSELSSACVKDLRMLGAPVKERNRHSIISTPAPALPKKKDLPS